MNGLKTNPFIFTNLIQVVFIDAYCYYSWETSLLYNLFDVSIGLLIL